MSLDLAPVAPPSSRPLYRLIRRTRFLLRVTRIVTGLALTVGLFLGALAIVTAVDLLLPQLQIPFRIAFTLDPGLRLACLLLVVLPSAAAMLIGVVFPLFRRFSAGYVARRIEAQIPGIHNRLVSCIDLEARGRAAASPVFYRRLLTESLDRIHGFRPRRVLDFVKLRRAGLIAVAGTLAFAVVYCVFSQNLPTAMARIFHPLDDIPPVAGVAYTVEPGGGAFLRENKIDFAAHITQGETGALTLALRADNDTARDMPLEQLHDGSSLFQLQLDTVSIGQAYQNGFHYRVHGGGTWSPRYEVRLVERPLITNIDTSVYYPGYMAIPEGHPTPREAAEIIGPDGAEIEVVVQAEGQVAAGEIQSLALVRTETPTYRVEKTFPMHSVEAGRWVGRLPLIGKGLFRAEMRNKEGHANKPMAELRYTAVKDQPPQVVLQRPGVELTLGEPQAPPLTIAAFDDYGLKDVTVFYRDNESQPYQSRILRHFDKPERDQTVVAPLQEAAALKQGGALHYYIQASDRKDQTARTPEYVVRIAADKQEAAFDMTQDGFHDRLLKLIARQKAVQTKVEKIDPEMAKQQAKFKNQLADLGQEEDNNAEDASRLNDDLTKANAEAEKLQTLPPAVSVEMKALQKTFEQTAVKAMKNLSEQFKQGADPKADTLDLKYLSKLADRLAKDLESVKDRMEARTPPQRVNQEQATKSQQQPMPPLSGSIQSGGNPPVSAADLSKLSPSAREAVMKLPPRVREELLQGLGEQGPEGYGPFIEDYFKRLMETKTP
jgi:predicted  nucleic acid-binding Zn-ribbon protein